MSQHPLNLGIRFLLELAALGAMGYWGWSTRQDGWRWLIAIGVVVLAASAWGVFRVPGDPGDAPVAVPGVVRLLLEALFFGFAIWGLFQTGPASWATVFLIVTLVHYALSSDRLLALFLGRTPPT